MKYQFKTGDGITWKTCSVSEREEIYKLLEKNKYPLYRKYINNYNNHHYAYNDFGNNFYFNRQGKWCTAAVKAVTNPMTFEQMKNLIEFGGEPNYEIY